MGGIGAGRIDLGSVLWVISLGGHMHDRVVGVFEDLTTAEEAGSALVAEGVEADRVTVKRVLQPTHRGIADSDTVHSLIHAPPIREGDRTSEDAGTVILVVDMIDPSDEPDDESKTLDIHDNDQLMSALERLGATDTQVVEATPGLDL